MSQCSRRSYPPSIKLGSEPGRQIDLDGGMEWRTIWKSLHNESRTAEITAAGSRSIDNQSSAAVGRRRGRSSLRQEVKVSQTRVQSAEMAASVIARQNAKDRAILEKLADDLRRIVISCAKSTTTTVPMVQTPDVRTSDAPPEATPTNHEDENVTKTKTKKKKKKRSALANQGNPHHVDNCEG